MAQPNTHETTRGHQVNSAFASASAGAREFEKKIKDTFTRLNQSAGAVIKNTDAIQQMSRGISE
ncbi:MAG: hypothetical protein LBV54_05430, partial [Puniceicoccales bacterium]|nr:hypothetical protein [Puniceicoccales bacterium]